MAAINWHDLVAIGVNTDATSYASGSVTPTNGRIAFVAACSRLVGTEPTTPTCSGNSQTWIAVGNIYAAPVKLTVFYAITASATAGSATVDYAGQTQGGHAIVYGEIANANTTTPVVQFKTGSVAAGTSYTVTLDNAFGSAWNGVLCFNGVDVNDNTVRSERGYHAPYIAATPWLNPRASDGIALTIGWRPNNDAANVFANASGNGVGLMMEIAQNGSDVGGGGNANILTGSVVK